MPHQVANPREPVAGWFQKRRHEPRGLSVEVAISDETFFGTGRVLRDLWRSHRIRDGSSVLLLDLAHVHVDVPSARGETWKKSTRGIA